MGDVLFVGPKNSGKSLLLRRMQTLSDEKRLTPFDPIPSTKSTNGIETSSFKYRSQTYVFKELGGGSISEWEVHARTARAIVYVFDAADLTQVAANVVWLNEIITSHNFEQKPILIVLSKCDVPECIRFNVIDEIIGFDRTLNPTRLAFMETSSVVGVGLSDIYHWITDKLK